MWTSDLELDEPLTFDVVAETVGARRSVVVRLAQEGLIETVDAGADEPLVPRRMVVQLRRMQRLRRDLDWSAEQAMLFALDRFHSNQGAGR